jgi:predicted  nucleic acid-binding Zn-ribbon protein
VIIMSDDLRDVIDSAQQRKSKIQKSIDRKRDKIERLEQEIKQERIKYRELKKMVNRMESVYDKEED